MNSSLAAIGVTLRASRAIGGIDETDRERRLPEGQEA
jgi:hypothetical protein